MISVCMALFNGDRFLLEQVKSILSQLGERDELIVSDDGSTDSSLLILQGIADSRIRIITNTDRLGPSLNLERALNLSRGDIIFLTDHDDVWKTKKVSRCLGILQKADLVLHDASIIDTEGSEISPSLFSIRGVKRGFWRNWFRNSYTGCCMAFRRSVLEASLPFPSQIPMHDQWIGLVAERKFRVAFLNEVLISYRQHGNNATNTVYGSNNTIWTRLRWRISLLRSIFILH